MIVFLDSNIIQHAATTYRTMDIYFGGAKPGEPLIRYGPIETISKEPAKNEKLREEIDCLPELSSRLKSINARLIMDFNNSSEIKRAGRFRPEYFHGSEIHYADRPPEYNAVLGMPNCLNPPPTNNHFHNFLHRLKHPRFLELAKYAGALQGPSDNYNQLSDAYFLWCAEANKADYFLTLDFKLKKMISQAKSLTYETKVVSAMELLVEIKNA